MKMETSDDGLGTLRKYGRHVDLSRSTAATQLRLVFLWNLAAFLATTAVPPVRVIVRETKSASTAHVLATCAALWHVYLFKGKHATVSAWYACFLGLAFISAPAFGISSSDHFFGSGSQCIYTIVLSAFNANIILWCLVYHARLIYVGANHAARVACLVGSLVQLGLAKMQALQGLLSKTDANNCILMLSSVVSMTLLDMVHENDRPSFERGEEVSSAPKTRSVHNTWSLAMHSFYVFFLFIHSDPLRAFFDFDSNVDREKHGLRLGSTLAGLQWLMGYMVIELVYLLEQRTRDKDLVDVSINVLVDVAKQCVILKTAHFCWSREARAGGDPSIPVYLANAAAHTLCKAITLIHNVTNLTNEVSSSVDSKRQDFFKIFVPLASALICLLIYYTSLD